MSGWPEKERKRHEDLLRGQGKHEALLLQCRLRERRHPLRESLQMKYMEREKKKIEAELLKIRHTIQNEKRNPRALSLSTRSLTMETVAPSRRHSFSAQTNYFPPASNVSPRRVTNTRLSLDPALLASTERSFGGKRSSQSHTLDEVAIVEQTNIPPLLEIHEESTDAPVIGLEQPQGGDAVDNTVPSSDTKTVPDVDVVLPEQVPPIVETAATVAAAPTLLSVPGAPGATGNQLYENKAVPRLCHRQPTYIKGRQPSFMNRSNTYIKRRRELSNLGSDILSCSNYNEMRQGIANETLKKLGLL